MPFVVTAGTEQGKAITFSYSLNEKPDNTWTHQLSLALLHNRMLQSQKTQVLSQGRKPQAVWHVFLSDFPQSFGHMEEC